MCACVVQQTERSTISLRHSTDGVGAAQGSAVDERSASKEAGGGMVRASGLVEQDAHLAKTWRSNYFPMSVKRKACILYNQNNYALLLICLGAPYIWQPYLTGGWVGLQHTYLKIDKIINT